MTNSMDINLRGDNSMSNLTFSWIAIFSDGFTIEQFENNNEHRFQEVKDKFDKLVRFSLVNKDYSQCFTIDLQLGIIIYNHYNLKHINLEAKKENIRLIFFRRHQIEITEKCIENSHNIEYHLGFQYNDKLGNNRQTVLIIDSQGNWYLGD